MQNLQNWNQSMYDSFQNLWEKVANFIPQLLGALLVLIIGLVVASILSKIVQKFITFTHIDEVLDRIHFIQQLKSRCITLSVSNIIGQIVKWFFIILTFMTIADILKLKQLNSFLESILLFLPNGVIAIIILAIGFIVGQFIAQIVKQSALASNMDKHFAHLLGMISEWAIIAFSLMASLFQLGVATSLIQILFTGIIATFTLAFGLAFGLGGRESAAKILEEIEKNKP